MNDADKAFYRNKVRERPAAAEIVTPGPGQESVWNYPRPPRVRAISKSGKVELNGHEVASSSNILKVMETASPPTYYFPPDDIDRSCLIESTHTTFCEWKGEATYWHVVVNETRVENAVWSYQDPLDDAGDCRQLKGFFAFYPQALGCTLGDHKIDPQQGAYYGGWITPDITGPFKGPPGTQGW